MKLSPIQTFKLKELFFVILYWVIMVRLIVVVEYFGFDSSGNILTKSVAFSILQENLLAATSAGFVIGLITGIFELYIFQRFFRGKAFIKLIFTKLLVYLVSIILISFITLNFYYFFGKQKDFLESLSSALNMFKSNGFYYLFVVGALLSLGINFVLITKNKIGHSIFISIILGKYHNPKEEERIFLFIDLQSSTYMAEQLGHIKYSQLIQDCFLDLSDLVIKYQGAIYQYVGDEAVITWKVKRKENFTNSILLFFAFREFLERKSDFYQKKYGTIPVFKAAINSGKVMVAEVGGSLKSEIAYHGDVLNSASRMLELCKVYNKDFMLSENIMEKLSNLSSDINIEFKGELLLRGKDKKMSVYSASEGVQQKNLNS